MVICKHEGKIKKMTNYEVIREICKENNGIVTASMVAEKEVPSWYLSDMVKKGELVRVARGIYGTNESDYDDYYFFQRRNGRCIFSYASALHLHGLTDRVPFQKEVTVYKGYNSSHITDNTTIHHVNKDIYELGITDCTTVFGNRVKVYDKERTICDLIYSRKDIDVEVFSKAIKTYIADPERDYKKLREYAKKMKIADKLDDILEVI